VALVTGSSRGLGSAIALRLARDDLAVAVNSLHGEREALDVVGAIRDHGGVADSFAADATDDRAAAELVAAVTGTLGSVDVLVLNATGPQPEAPLAATARTVRICHRQERADRARPQLGARAGAGRHHRQRGRPGVHPRRAPRRGP
jgi:NAD(P)-dependent dehydrogenase (short-subunit alcohol dehydrogenase family)